MPYLPHGDAEAAALARRKADFAVLEEKIRRAEVRKVAARLRELQEKNHFHDLIEWATQDNSHSA